MEGELTNAGDECIRLIWTVHVPASTLGICTHSRVSNNLMRFIELLFVRMDVSLEYG